MKYKKLIYPGFKINVGEFEIVNGITVECFSSKEAQADWCNVKLNDSLNGIIQVKDMDAACVELGYEDDFDIIMNGNVRLLSKDYWKEIMIKDDMIKLERYRVKESFLDCTPQDIIKYILVRAGITTYELSKMDYGKKEKFSIPNYNAIEAIKLVNSSWGISNNFFFRDRVFYWGTKKDQEYQYTLIQNQTILGLQKLGDLWECETVGVPWIHHSETVEIIHTKISGVVEIKKVIIKSDDSGAVRQYIYF